MPNPRKGESREDFISRCVSDPESIASFPDEDQRLAVCYSRFAQHKARKHAAAAGAPAGVAPGGAPNTSPPTFGGDDEKRKHAADSDAETVTIDDTEYRVVRGVPLVDEHEDLTEDELQEIVENSRLRIADTGDASPIFFGAGHTSDFEGSDRPVYGFAQDFRLGTLGKVDPRPCILADLYIRADKFEESKLYPRRSIELWKDPEQGCWIDGIALLGGTTPKRALGLVFSKRGASSKSGVSRLKRYELTEDSEVMASEIKPEEQDKFNKMLEASAIGKYLKKLMESDESEGEREEEEDSTGDVDKHAKDEEDCDDSKMAKGAKLSKAERANLQLRDAKTELVRYQKQVEAQQVQLTELSMKFRKQERQGDLERLRFEGYSFDTAEELEYVLPMDDAAYSRHLSKIKSRYSKAPLNLSPIPTCSMTEAKGGATAEQSKERAAKATKYALKHGCDYEEALKKVSG